MTILIGILLALAVFMIIVTIHELGHFAFAKMFGVKVYEFGLGIPPKIMKVFSDKSGTEYTLNWLPLGGFVRLKGESSEEDGANDSDSILSKPVWQQLLIISGGVLMNFILAVGIFIWIFFQGFQPIEIIKEFQPGNILSEVVDDSRVFQSFDTFSDFLESDIYQKPEHITLYPWPELPAHNAGVREGDKAVSINGEIITDPVVIQEAVKTNEKVLLTVLSSGEEKELTLIPKNGKIGVFLKDWETKHVSYPLSQAITYGTEETIEQSRMTLRVFVRIIDTLLWSQDDEEREQVLSGVGGPIAIGGAFVGLASQELSLMNILLISALISISLGIFNALPIPALDGGRFFVIALNGIGQKIWKRDIVNGRIEGYIHLFGFIFLILLSILIAYKDITDLL